jgi:hypothetical protein
MPALVGKRLSGVLDSSQGESALPYGRVCATGSSQRNLDAAHFSREVRTRQCAGVL